MTEEERAVLEFVLEPDFQGAEALRDQVRHAEVDGLCGCGCPSFSLAIDKSQAARDVNPRTPVDCEAESVDLDPLYQPFLQVGNRLADSPSNRMVERRI